MARLTARRPDNGLAYLVGVKPNEQEVDSPHPNTLRCILDCFQRLAEYEDTGLTPEEIQRVKAERDAAISCISRNCAHIEFIEGGISYCVLKGAGCDDCEDVWCKAGDSE